MTVSLRDLDGEVAYAVDLEPAPPHTDRRADLVSR